MVWKVAAYGHKHCVVTTWTSHRLYGTDDIMTFARKLALGCKQQPETQQWIHQQKTGTTFQQQQLNTEQSALWLMRTWSQEAAAGMRVSPWAAVTWALAHIFNTCSVQMSAVWAVREHSWFTSEPHSEPQHCHSSVHHTLITLNQRFPQHLHPHSPCYATKLCVFSSVCSQRRSSDGDGSGYLSLFLTLEFTSLQRISS